MRRWALILAAGSMVTALEGQVVRTSFERDVNLFRWSSDTELVLRPAAWNVELSNRFVSDAFVQFDNSLRFRDENHLRLHAVRPFANRYSAHIRGHLDWFGLSRAYAQALYGGVRAQLSPSSYVEPFAGLAMDRRPGVPLPDGTLPRHLDTGPAFGLRLGAERSRTDGYQLRLGGEGTWQQISPRRGRAVAVDGRAHRMFGGAALTAGLRIASRRRDTYQSASFLNRNVSAGSTIEATVSDTLDALLEIEVPLARVLRLVGQADLRINQRRIRTHQAPEQAIFFDTNFNRRALDATVGAVLRTRNTEAQLMLITSAAAEGRQLANTDSLPPSEAAQKTRLLLQADYDEGVLGIRGSYRAALWPGLKVALRGSSRIVRHDTPEANPDDRDEVYHQGEVGLQWTVSPATQADLWVFGSWYHAVYLKAARSAENNVQRSLRLRPGLRWTPSPRTQVRLTTEVRATYTVDDFVLAGRRPTDQSARELRVESELMQTFWQDATLRVSGSFADLRLGRLQWDSFSEIPFDTLRTYNAWGRWGMGQRLRTEIGWRVYMRSNYSRTATVRYERVGPDGEPVRDETGRALTSSISRPGRRWIRQMGPTGTLTWQRGRSSVRLEAWANFQHVSHRLYGDLPEQSADRIRAAARRGTRRLIPLVALAVTWEL